MINKLLKPCLSQHYLEMLLTGVLLTVGMAGKAVSLESKNGLSKQADQSTSSLVKQAKLSNTVLREGTYFYGESPNRDQIGKEYLVFEVRDGKVVGAAYLPASEFSCFHGTVNASRLNLTVLDPYEETANSQSIALKTSSQVATSGRNLPTGDVVGLEGYHRISSINNNDQRILNACKASQQ